MEGGTNRSYGIQVARIAGVPEEVIVRSKEVLRNLEKGEFDSVGMPKIARGRKASTVKNKDQLSLFMEDDEIIINELQDLDLMNLTPLEAINRISIWKDRLLNKQKSD
jgi:DNA mismatch repair protein MutS